jgi:zinc protease
MSLALLLTLVLAVPPAVFPVENTIPEDVVMKTLPNGLIVAVKEYRNAPVVTAKLFVKVGCVFEEEYLGAGMSHYCEHLVMGGTTPTRTEQESQKIMEEMGVQMNAYTTADHTCYYIHSASQDWEQSLDLLSDWVMNCAMDSAEVAREKGVITREINMGEDEPGRVVYKLLMKTVFPNTPLGYPTIGYRDNFVRTTHEQIQNFYEKYYVPNNTALVVVGDIDASEVMAKAEELMGGWERQPLLKASLPVEPTQIAKRVAHKEWPGEVTYLRIAWPTIHLTHPDLYALDLLAGVLGNGRSSLLYEALKEEKGLVHDVGVYSYTPHFGPGPFVVTALLPPENEDETVETLLEMIERVKKKGVSDADIDRAKTQVIADYSFSRQSCNDLASSIGRDVIHTGDPYFSARYAERISQVTPQQLVTVARRYLVPEHLSVVSLGPGSGPMESTVAASEEGLQSDISKTVLPNGLRLLTKQNANIDVVSVYAGFAGGTRYETETSNGIFALMSRCLRRGTKKLDASEIDAMVETRGGTLASGSAKDYFWVRLDLLAEDLEFGMKLMGELLTQATFPEEEIEKQKTELLAELQEQEDDWQSEAYQFYLSTYFDKHPYHFNTLGDRAIIPDLTKYDIRKAYQRHVRAGSGVIAVFGNVDEEQVAQLAQEYMAEIPDGSCPEPHPAELPQRDAPHRATKVNEKGQVTICLGYPAAAVGHQDEYPLRLIDAVTSGVFLPRGWLHEALRGRNDLVYFVHMVPIFYKEAGTMVVLTQCQTDLTDSVLTLIEDEMARARAGQFTEDDVQSAKTQYITATNLYTQTMADQAARFARYELYGLGFETALAFDENINAVALEDVQRVASGYLTDGVLTLAGPLDGDDGEQENAN